MNIAIIFAGGSGIRMGAGIPKQYLDINGKPVLIHTLELFEEHEEIDKIYLAVNVDYMEYTEELISNYHITKVEGLAEGGESAQDSIYNALCKARENNPGDSIVLIHDGVRPFINYEVISKNIESVIQFGSAITSTLCYETIMISKDGEKVSSVPYRKETYAAQAPQSFFLDEILQAHEQIRKRENRYENIVDSCTMYKELGRDAHIVIGNRGNIKVTTPEDVYMFRALLQYRENEQTFGLGLTDQGSRKLKRLKRKWIQKGITEGER